MAKILDEASASTDDIRLDIDALLVRTPGHVVLIDTGFGPAGHGVLRESLALARVSADGITDVLITHCHQRRILVKIDVTAMRLNLRFMVMNRPGCAAALIAWYDARGSAENRIKELFARASGEFCSTLQRLTASTQRALAN